jgi:site-specific DNA-methyltransferase (adenine-specific)
MTALSVVKKKEKVDGGSIVLYAEIKPCILAATHVEEVKEICDQAQAWAKYWAAKKDHHKAIEGASAYILAAWKGGELLKELEKRPEGRPLKNSVTMTEFSRVLEAAKLSESTAKRWQRIARVWEQNAVESYIDECYQQDKVPTLQYLLREVRKNDRSIISTNFGSWRVEQADVATLDSVSDESIDVIITDPPYPKEYLSVYSALSATANRVLKPGGSCFVLIGQSYLPEVITRLSESLTYQWTLAYLTPGGQSVQLFQRNVNTFWKPVLWFSKGKYTGKWLGDVCKSDTNDNDKNHHHWGQSESGMVSLVSRCSERGQIVLDPFCGAGTTGIACVIMGRHFIGSDIDASLVKKTLERIEEISDA